MNSGSVMMISGGALAILGGAFLWRGWARWHDCRTEPAEGYLACDPFNPPFMTGIVLAPLGMATMVLGGALALIQVGERG